MDIVFNLNKNDNPEFPKNGIDKTLVIGTTFKTILLPSLLRQLFQTVSTEDIIDNIQVINSTFDQDALYLYMNVNLKSGEEFSRTLAINGN
jgi:hypothetical protein